VDAFLSQWTSCSSILAEEEMGVYLTRSLQPHLAKVELEESCSVISRGHFVTGKVHGLCCSLAPRSPKAARFCLLSLSSFSLKLSALSLEKNLFDQLSLEEKAVNERAF
jgi:hypothetical protein